MAEVIKKFEFSPGRGNGRYPWNEWLDGRAWKLKFGTDFRCGMTAFRASCYGAAARTGKTCRTEAVGEDEIVIQAFDK